MSDLRINNITDRTGDSGPVFAGVSTVTSTGAFTVPVGPTEYRGGRGRAVISGGFGPSIQSTMDKFEIATTGNATSFGSMAGVNAQSAMVASSTRGVIGGYSTPSPSTSMYYFTFSSDGGVSDFGNLQTATREKQAGGNSTRGLFEGGNPSLNTAIEFITIATTGDGSHFGDLLGPMAQSGRINVSSPTRAIVTRGGNTANTLEFITIATLGDAKDFGDLANNCGEPCGTSNSTRAIFAGGYISPTTVNTISYVTIATAGNSVDYGDLSNKGNQLGGASSSTRSVFCGNLAPAGGIGNVMEYVTIATTGNTTDFGDLTVNRAQACANSNVHGGLG